MKYKASLTKSMEIYRITKKERLLNLKKQWENNTSIRKFTKASNIYKRKKLMKYYQYLIDYLFDCLSSSIEYFGASKQINFITNTFLNFTNIFDLIKVNKMINRITKCLPKYTLYNLTTYRFSNNQKQPNQPEKRPQKPNISNRLETSFVKYIRNLLKEAKSRKQGNNFSASDFFNKFTSKPGNFSDNAFGNRETAQANIWIIALMIAGALFLLDDGSNQQQKSVTNRTSKIVNQSQMLGLLASGNFNLDLIIVREAISTNNNPIYQTICVAKEANKTEYPVTCVLTNIPAFLNNLQKINIPYRVSFNYAAQTHHSKSSINIGNIILFGLAAFIFYKYKTGGFNFGNNGLGDLMNTKKFEPIKPENIKTHFKDVAGMHQAKQEITEFVDFLKNPDRYIEMGAKIPKGALLTGPPGTGKTLLARACAGQAGVPFFYVSGSQFVQKYVGMGANRVRSLFQSAAKSAPSIIFIDQIDAIGKKRNSGPFSNQQKENTLNQLLVNMDGFDSKHKIIVLAATNIKQSLDPALLRPGRFDRSVQIGLPNFEQRIEILKVHLTKVKFSSQFTIQELGKKISILTPGFSGAQLANICNEAAILAARVGKSQIDLPQFEKATERVMAGLEKRNLFSDQQKQCLAYYECGKAVASWFTEGADPVIKISITPYSKSGKGYSHELKNEMPLKTQAELINKVICYLAGRTAQKVIKGYTTSNGDEDMKKAKRIISYLVVKFGMSSLGKIGFPDIDYVRKPYSQETEKKIDRQIERIYRECQQKTEVLVKERRQYIQKLKLLILQKQTLSHNTIKQVLGERPFPNNENYQKFLHDKEEKPQTAPST